MSRTPEQLLKLTTGYQEVAEKAIVVEAKKKEKKLDPKAKVRNRGTVCVPAEQAKDKKDHFPINDEGQARNALARVQQLSSAPWYKGTLEGLKALVARKVKAKYPKINVGGKKEKKSSLDVSDTMLDKYARNYILSTTQFMSSPPAKYAQQPPATVPATIPVPVPATVPVPVPVPAAPVAPDAAAKIAAIAAAKAAAAAAKAAADAAVKAAAEAAAKLKALETAASRNNRFAKYSDNAAPSAHVRAWDPSAKGTPPSQEPSINHVEGNVGTDRKATDAMPGVGVDAPSHKATDTRGGVNAPSHKATDLEPGKGVDAPSHKATDSSDARAPGGTQTAGGAPINDNAPTSNDGKSSSDVRSPTSTEVRSPTSTEVRSPTSTEVRSPTSTSTEVRSPTSTSTEAYTADNFTATVTGGAGDGANTTVNIYLTPPTTPKTNPNTPDASKGKKSSLNVSKALLNKYAN